MVNAQELKSNLAQFTGTENYYANWLLKYRYTDGVHYFIKQTDAFWFLEEVNVIYVQLQRQGKAEFLYIKATSDGKKADIVVDDGNDNILKERHISRTDLPEGEWQFYLYNNVLLLPSEY